YLVGVGGCGVSGLANLLLDLGFAVAGSDAVENEEIRQLWRRGAEIQIGHDEGLLQSRRPVLVVHSPAVRPDNPELIAARELQVRVIRRSVLLAALFSRQRGLAVTGMHGKTTTSALLAFTLEGLGVNPSFAIGARVAQLPRHARFSASPDSGPVPFFVIEADESDGTLRDFVCSHAILLNIDLEHLDHYDGIEAIRAEFASFLSGVPGKVVYCGDDPELVQLCGDRPGAISFGFVESADYCCEPGQGGFQVRHAGASLGFFPLRLYGLQNYSNATAVVALLHGLGYASSEIARAMASFAGAARRQEELLADGRFRVIDDYGHHPREIAATIAAVKERWAGRLLVAFQPHRFTRTQHLLGEFAPCFRGADRLWLTEIYAASEAPIAGVTGQTLAQAVRTTGQTVDFVGGIDRLAEAVRSELRPGDTVLFLGAGDITQVANQLAAGLRNETPVSLDSPFQELRSVLSPEAIVRCDEPLAKRTTLRVGGPADFYIEPASEQDLSLLLRLCARREIPFFILGRGSNLLVRDGGIRGVVICLAHPSFSRIEVVGDRLHCGAGARLKAVSVEARRRNLTGLEFLEGIPGSVGGSLRMNAGAMGGWIFETVESIRIMDHAGTLHDRPAIEVEAHYRVCPLLKTNIAIGAVLKGTATDPESVAGRMNTFNKKRWESQPAQPSAGCVFKNPSAIPAGRLIDELGLKGTRIGGAMVSDVHGNFIVNLGGATARDVLDLIEVVRRKAREDRGIELGTEVEIVGVDEPRSGV
ncbi:MAG: UDP-N-acetylmuramate--L-alanine ligase, partial [Opitutaceae bacterium]|nr:UDP-N-acetylmuramate--L-alanine ligase [Verrucomicrobiales bacterium]